MRPERKLIVVPTCLLAFTFPLAENLRAKVREKCGHQKGIHYSFKIWQANGTDKSTRRSTSDFQDSVSD